MISKVWLINLVLVTLVLFFGMEAWSVWSSGVDMPGAVQEKKDDKTDYSGKLSPVRLRNRAEYELIPSANLFSPERKEFIAEETESEVTEKQEPEKEAKETVEEKPLKELKERIYLQGVVVLKGVKMALVTNPYKKKPDDPKHLTVREGDLIDQLKVVEILPSKLVLEKGNDRYEIGLYDKKKPPRSIARAPGQGKEAPQIVTSSGEPQPQTPAQKPGVQPVQVVQPQKSDVDPTPGGEGESQGDGEAAFEYVSTPFGKIKRYKTK